MPYSDTQCLVSCGKDYRNLSMIVDAEYTFEDTHLALFNPILVKTGDYLRLGHRHPMGKIIYSDGWEVPHQPFQSDHGMYETAPGARDITRDGEPFLSLWDEMVEMGNPWVDGEWLYYEARNEPPPEGWELWRFNLEDHRNEYICRGANPCVFNGKLYYSVWVAGRFEYAIRD